MFFSTILLNDPPLDLADIDTTEDDVLKDYFHVKEQLLLRGTVPGLTIAI